MSLLDAVDSECSSSLVACNESSSICNNVEQLRLRQSAAWEDCNRATHFPAVKFVPVTAKLGDPDAIFIARTSHVHRNRS